MSFINYHYQRGIKIVLAVVTLGFLWMVFVAEGANTGYTFATYGGQWSGGGYGGYGHKGLELKVDSKAVYNGVLQPALTWDLKNLKPGVDHFFDFDDVKPGDMGRHTISLHVKKSNAFVCLDFENLQDFENGTNEPEALVDNTEEGELSENLEFFAWRDDGDDVFEVGERVIFGTTTKTADLLFDDTTYAVADAGTGNSCKANSINYVGIVWCAGDLEVNLDTAEISCDGSGLGNVVQTDSMSVDMTLRAVQAKYNDNFTCAKKVKSKPNCKKKNGKKCKPKGNNGHGNDEDHNDDSNPGNSNDEEDDTDDEADEEYEENEENGSGVEDEEEEEVNEEEGEDEEEGEIESERFYRVSEARSNSDKWRDSIRSKFRSIFPWGDRS